MVHTLLFVFVAGIVLQLGLSVGKKLIGMWNNFVYLKLHKDFWQFPS